MAVACSVACAAAFCPALNCLPLLSGVRVLVLNSPLFARPEGAPEESRQQCTWLLEELEQCKLCASQVVVFAYHSFTEQPEGAEEDR